jgi:hypothetical protein
MEYEQLPGMAFADYSFRWGPRGLKRPARVQRLTSQRISLEALLLHKPATRRGSMLSMLFDSCINCTRQESN